MAAIKAAPELPARVAQATAERDGDTTRVPLWTDAMLRGFRVKVYASGDEHVLRERLGLSVANLADRPREVWVEEELRPARRRKVLQQAARRCRSRTDGSGSSSPFRPAGSPRRRATSRMTCRDANHRLDVFEPPG